jgi:hypothetical protein
MQRRGQVLQHVHTQKAKRLGVNELHDKKISVAFMVSKKEKLNYYCTWGLLLNESGSVVEET